MSEQEILLSTPKFVFIGRRALRDEPERVVEFLRTTPVTGSMASCALDAKLAECVCGPVMGATQTFGIVADFPFDLAVINDQGSLVAKELPPTPEV